MTSAPRHKSEDHSEGVLIGGREKRVIRIVDYNPMWPERFAAERAKIERALGERALHVDHIGSTSVPGLAAKPIIDINVSVADPDDEFAYLADLEKGGYVLRVREPTHRMLRTPRRDVHVHICAAESAWEIRHLLFRDWLRVSSNDRRLYESTKRELAQLEWDEMNDYADAKSGVIAEITGRAEQWAADTSGEP